MPFQNKSVLYKNDVCLKLWNVCGNGQIKLEIDRKNGLLDLYPFFSGYFSSYDSFFERNENDRKQVRDNSALFTFEFDELAGGLIRNHSLDEIITFFSMHIEFGKTEFDNFQQNSFLSRLKNFKNVYNISRAEYHSDRDLFYLVLEKGDIETATENIQLDYFKLKKPSRNKCYNRSARDEFQRRYGDDWVKKLSPLMYKRHANDIRYSLLSLPNSIVMSPRVSTPDSLVDPFCFIRTYNIPTKNLIVKRIVNDG
ncbi:MAG: hypothetical protein WC755_01140 [Candidatus Woesearchaeota archaeon]|jgi:hypothetical protein